MERYFFLFRVAFESVLINKLRGMLTALGIVFGVAAVIAMLAIGSGAKRYLLDQMKLVGTNNIVFTHLSLEKKKDADEKNESTTETANSNNSKLETWAPGMSLGDLEV